MLLIVFILLNSGTALAVENNELGSNNLAIIDQSINKFVYENITKIAIELPEEGWDQTTKISNYYTTFDLEGIPNGYVFNLKTNEKESGYIQVFDSNNTLNIISYSFQGHHFLDEMIDAYEEKNNEKLTNSKIIYNGNLDFLIKESKEQDDTFYNLTTENFIKEKKPVLEKKYNAIKNSIVSDNTLSNSLSYTTGIKKYVINANNADLVEMDDFKGKVLNGEIVNNHCGPTAGTNLIKYWANRRGVSNLYYNSDWWVFSSLCVNMNTNFSTYGTLPWNLINGLRSYSSSTRGVSYSGYDLWGDDWSESVSFDKATYYIDVNVPFTILIDSGIIQYHYVSCFGYYTVDGARSLIINTGWNKNWTFQSFTSLSSQSYQYVRWN